MHDLILFLLHDLSHMTFSLQDIVIAELITRAAKHLFKSFMQGVDMMSLSSAVSHFLNCYLGSFPSPHAQITAEEVNKISAFYKLQISLLIFTRIDISSDSLVIYFYM